MILSELNAREIKCTCGSCEGTGVFKGFAEKDRLAVVCTRCNGRGYYTQKANNRISFVKDEKKGVVYIVKDGIISHNVSLFTKLAKRNDVEYVMYATGRVMSAEDEIRNGNLNFQIIRYKDFLEGKLPLPAAGKTCPRQFMAMYGKEDFENDCIPCGFYQDCEKFFTNECWAKFYEGAINSEERQNLLKRVQK